MSKTRSLFRALLILLAADTPSGSGSGAAVCPCINSSSPLYSAYESALVAGGLPATFGLSGCAAHDSNVSMFGCATNALPFCLNPWCYVDMDLCPENRELCEAAGGILGSQASPHCRTRKHNAGGTNILNLSEHYSYETCGSRNVYDTSELLEPIAGRTIRAAAAAWAPWVVKRKNLRNEDVWGGPSFDFFKTSLELFHPEPVIKIIPGWATAASRAKFPESSYTACVHDVAVGNFDICLADLWLTPQRNQLVTFLPAVRQDYFYLVVKKDTYVEVELTIWERLSKPFSPFTPGAWLGIVGFLCIMSVLLWLRQLCETGCHGDFKTLCKNNVVAILRSLFFVWHDFLLGQSSMDVETGPVRQIFSLALAFFILITLASYTASLATGLVVATPPDGTVNSIDDAIRLGMKICAPSSLLDTFSSVYRDASFVGDEIQFLPRLLHRGQCDVMVLSQDLIQTLFAGKVREQDCADFRAGRITQQEAQCREGDMKRDCEFSRVGDLLWSVPLSFPVSEEMAHAFSWSFTAATTRGVMEDAKRMNAQLFSQSICEDEESGSESLALTFDNMSGSMIISFFIMMIGFVVMAGRHFYRQQAANSTENEGSPDDGELKRNV
ncbi:unnamed protein product [Symbiodinium necroappetens]|uniref:Ionotropic glutamate receptor C-terminal domain-containing protein n=1 Tax=Symbiodinium necroappetens TaxID=1628268 RepID=A0A812X9B7_9DINO|nr:unnamed protein product [Symbiodinium necroappetens]